MVRPSQSPRDQVRRSAPTAEMVEARRLLLDALDALAPLLPAVVLGGGQAADLHLPAGSFPIPLSTRDGDLTVDVRALTRPARIGELLTLAGLEITGGHGHWARATNRLLQYFSRKWPVRIDMMVPDEPWPEAVAGPDPRVGGDASNMPPMVVTLLDDSPLAVPALDASDLRRRTVRVAGTASLLLTKVHKFETRRLRAVARRRPFSTIPTKDILDIVRLLLAPGEDIERDVHRIRLDARGAGVARESLSYLDEHFSRNDGLGTRLAREALEPYGGGDLAVKACLRAARICVGSRYPAARS